MSTEQHIDTITIDTIIYARWILPIIPRRQVYTDCGLAINNGNILGIYPAAELARQFSAQEVIRLDHHALMPGLVNAHGHAAMSLLRGFADDLPLMDWLQNHIWPAEQQWVDEHFVHDGAKLAIAEMIKSGCTCFSDMYFFPEATARIAHETGMRAQVCFPILDFSTNWASGPDDSIRKGLDLHDTYRSHPLVSIAFGPHAPYTVSDEPLQRIATLAEEMQAAIQIHLHETTFEVDTAVHETGLRPIERLEQLSLLTPLTQCVHMTQVNQQDINVLTNSGANVIHCPKSNIKLASGLCPVQTLKDNGINVALGTDGAASNNTVNMFDELQTAALLAKLTTNDTSALDAHSALEMATLNGAKALGIDSHIGSLEAGKCADVIAIKLDSLEYFPLYDVASQLVYTRCAHSVTDSWINGKSILRNGQLSTINEQQVREKTLNWQQKISASRP